MNPALPITTWFNSPARFAALHAQARLWQGTPWMPNGNTLGRGVSCQKLASEIYRAVGCCDIAVPEVAMAHARFSQTSLLDPWMNARPEFARLPDPPRMVDLLPGDLIGLIIGHVVHHCGIYLGQTQFLHAMDQLGVTINCLTDGTWSPRLASAWRPRP